MTPNILARTIETVEGGGIVVFLLRTVKSVKSLYTMTMVHRCCSCFLGSMCEGNDEADYFHAWKASLQPTDECFWSLRAVLGHRIFQESDRS
jgi:tRNA(Met) C34 N-acetyltransferase TmcA